MGAIPVDDRGSVLLARRGIQPFYGDWNTIGGFLGYQEEPLDGLKREVREETGVDCEMLDFITMAAEQYGDGGAGLLCCYFTVRLLPGILKPQDDVSELAWFSLDNLPDNMPFASDRRALAVLRERRSGKR
jgi:ADP-ribose pyrophosphatase YjhB (NUDIX family)